MSEFTEPNPKFRGAFVLLLTVAITGLFFALIQSFIEPLLLAAIFTAMVHPIYRRFFVLFRRRATPASIVTIIILIVLIFGPVTGFVGLVAKQAVEIKDNVLPWIQENVGSESYDDSKAWLLERAPFLADFLPDRDQIIKGITNLAESAGQFLVNSAAKMTAGTASFFLSTFVMLYAMFFFLIDGRKILERILYYVPLGSEEEELMLDRFRSITRATIKGTIVIGIIQGSLGGIGFYFAGINGAAFWGTIMIILSIVPGIGTALVWIPAVIYLLATGDVAKGLILGAYMGAIVGTVDNVLRPVLVGRDAEMPDLLILLGTLGGIFLFGVIGFIIGPVICGLFLTVWEIYGQTFKAWLPPVKPLHRKKGEKPASPPSPEIPLIEDADLPSSADEDNTDA